MAMIATGEWIKKARKAVGMAAAQLAEAAGVSLNHIQRIEQGSRLPSPSVMDRIEETLGVTRMSMSFDTEELIEELECDVAEFGPDEDCWLIYKPIGDYVCFTDYQVVVLEEPLKKSELMPDETAMMTTSGEALEWLRRQDSIF